MEHFIDAVGAYPIINNNKSSWNISNFNENINYNSKNQCSPGTICISNESFGIYNNLCNCITNNINKYDTLLNDEEDMEYEEDLDKNIIDEEIDLNENDDCYPINTNFEGICKMKNSDNGIKKITKCNNDNYKVECGYKYINGIYYGDKIITPCFNKNNDFNDWCKYYNTSNIPDGYNLNSINAKEILVGYKGGCYKNNGDSDDNSARAICEYKLNYSDYNNNVYTNCLLMNENNFIPSCINLMNNSSTVATNIMAYDCNPGYGRAICMKSNNNNQINDIDIFENEKSVLN